MYNNYIYQERNVCINNTAEIYKSRNDANIITIKINIKNFPTVITTEIFITG